MELFPSLFAIAGGLAPLSLLVFAKEEWDRRRRLRDYFARSAPTLIMPSSEETAASVERFHEAVRRWELVDFVWDRWGKAAFRTPKGKKPRGKRSVGRR